MAKRSAKPVGKGAATSATFSAPGLTPLPPTVLHVSKTTWRKDQFIHRIHEDLYAPNTFNPGLKGNARFSPIKTTGGDPIPTLYGGTTFDCAVMETVFHDIPFAAGFKSQDKRKLEGQRHSVLLPANDLVLADLSNVALRKLGIQRGQLIDTEKDQYPNTRQWAEAIHAQCPDIQGLCWISRQDDRAQAVVLFGDRIDIAALLPQSVSRDVLRDLDAYAEVLSLAERIGVNLIRGKS